MFAFACAGHPTDPAPSPPPVPAPAPPAPPAAVPAPRPACTDGGEFKGARIAATGVRACIDSGCWAYDLDTGSATPIADLGSDGFLVEPRKYGEAPVPDVAPAWTTKPGEELDDAGRPRTWQVCGPAGCATYRPPGLPANESYSLAVSESGARVAAVHGVDPEVAEERVRVDVYERATGKRLGSVGQSGTECIRDASFAGESTVVQYYGCPNHGGTLTILSPAGKVVAQKLGFYWFDGFDRVDGDRWVFPGTHDAHVRIVDVVTGKIAADYELQQGFTARAAAGKVYGFEGSRVTRFDVATGKLAAAEPPSCRWKWENEAIAGLRVGMTGRDAIKALGMPARKAGRDGGDTAWQYGDGLVLVMHATDPTVPPRIVAIELAAPSTRATSGGVGIGSTKAELDAAYGAHAVADGMYGNAGESGGIHVTVADGRVSAIAIRE